jgi:hypothetical protein
MSAGESRPRARPRERKADGAPPLAAHSAVERGQASVELLAMLPLVLAVALAAAQLLAVGYSSVLAGNAAEAGALALAGGGDAADAARGALPGWSRARARVKVAGGEVTVHLHPPALLSVLAGELAVRGRAEVEAP